MTDWIRRALSRWSAPARRAMDKRRLERLLHREGLSRANARRIVALYFGGPDGGQ